MMNFEDKISRKNYYQTLLKQRLWVSKMLFSFVRKQPFCAVAPCGWVICSVSLETTYRPHLQGYKSIHGLKPDDGGGT